MPLSLPGQVRLQPRAPCRPGTALDSQWGGERDQLLFLFQLCELPKHRRRLLLPLALGVQQVSETKWHTAVTRPERTVSSIRGTEPDVAVAGVGTYVGSWTVRALSSREACASARDTTP